MTIVICIILSQSLLRDQICKSDLEATANALEQQIIHQSLLDQLGSRKVQESEDSSGRKRRRSSVRVLVVWLLDFLLCNMLAGDGGGC